MSELSEQNRALMSAALPEWRAKDLDAQYIALPAKTVNRLLDAARAEGAPKTMERETFAPTHRHVQRGTDYQVHCVALAQIASDIALEDMEEVTVYQGEDGQWWARPTAEFNDGRFADLSDGKEGQ